MPEAAQTNEVTAVAQPSATDPILLAAVELARAALLEITPAETIGAVIGHIDEGDRVISLLFDSLMTGYPGWRWTVSLARVDENAEPSVLETELTPGDDALLAPEWIPWSDRLIDDETSDESHDDDEEENDDDDEENDDEFDDESVEDDAEDSLDALNGIDFDEALAAAELHPDETSEPEAGADHGAPQPPTRSRRARRP